MAAISEIPMKKILLAAGVAATAVALSGCTSLGKADPAITKAIADKIPYCSGDIQFDAGLGGIAGTGTGLKNSAQLHCPGQVYPAPAGAAPAAP